MCIVMDYYPLGDLEICLRKKRENKEKFDELVLKKWIGQIIDAMTFVHEKVGTTISAYHVIPRLFSWDLSFVNFLGYGPCCEKLYVEILCKMYLVKDVKM